MRAVSAPARTWPSSPASWICRVGLPGCGSSCAVSAPTPGAQLRFDDVDGYRLTAFATNTSHGQLADLELRHRRRARCEDRIRNTGHRPDQPAPARVRTKPDLVSTRRDCRRTPPRLDRTPRTTRPPARRWEPKRLRLRLFQTPAVLARHARHTVLHISARHAWASVIISAATALRALPAPAG